MEKFCTQCRYYYTGETTSCPECGGPTVDAGLKPGMIVGGFKITGELGRGSNGIVYRARQVKLEREVALKILPAGRHADKTYVENFFREARAAARLSHPSIVMAFDAGVSDAGVYFFAMELIDGESLDHRVMEQGPMELKSALKIACDIAEGLEYAWRTQHLTHGDIKPANIILDPAGGAKIADLGLAKTAGEGFNGELMATPMFAAPEVCNFEFDKIGFKSDMYSYACTIYFMFAGVPPFNESDTEKVMQCHIHEQPEPLTGHLPLFPPEISGFINRMLAKNPDLRPSNWQEVCDFMTAAFRRYTAPAPSSPPPRSRRKAILPAAAGMLFLPAAAALVLYFGIFRPAPAEPPPATTTAAPPETGETPATAENRAQFQARLAALPPERQSAALREYSAQNPGDHEIQEQIQQMLRKRTDAPPAKQQEPNPLLKRFLHLESVSSSNALPYSDLREIIRNLQRLDTEIRLQNSLDADFRDDLCARVASALARLEPLSASGMASAEKTRLADAAEDLKKQPLKPFPSVKLPAADPRRELFLQTLFQLRKGMPWQEHSLQELNALLTPPKPGVHKNDAQLLHFLRQQALKCNKLIPVLADNKQLFVNKPLPWEPQGSVRIAGLDRRNVTLGREVEAGALLRNRVPWSSFSQAQLAELVTEWLLPLKPEAITPAEWSDLAGWLFFNGEPDLLTRLLARENTLPAADRDSWNRLMNEFTSASSEYEGARLMNAAGNALDKQDYRTALQLLARLRDKKHAPIPEKLQQALHRYSPLVPVEDIYRRAGEELAQNRFIRALTAACTVVERCGSTNSPSTPGPAAEAMRDTIVARHLPPPVRDPEFRQDIFLPPGSVAKWRSAMDTPLTKRPGFDASIQLAARLDLGQWHRFFNTPEFGASYREEIRKLPDGWREAALYDLGILYHHFGEQRREDELFRLLSEDVRGGTRQAVPVMRYAVCTRNHSGGLQLSQRLLSGSGIHAYRIAVARLLMLMQNPSYSESDFAGEVAKLKELFSSLKLDEDFKFLDWASSVYGNSPEPIPFPANLNRCREKEFLARLGCDVLARDQFLDRPNHPKIQLNALLTSDSTYNYDLWYRYALLSMAKDGPRLSAWHENLAALYADSRVAAIPSYPRLVMLECLAAILNGSLDPAAAGACFKPALDTLPMASGADRAFTAILSAESAPAPELSSSSVWHTLAALARRDTPPDFAESGAAFPDALQLWPERLLLRDFATLLKATAAH